MRTQPPISVDDPATRAAPGDRTRIGAFVGTGVTVVREHPSQSCDHEASQDKDQDVGCELTRGEGDLTLLSEQDPSEPSGDDRTAGRKACHTYESRTGHCAPLGIWSRLLAKCK